MPRPADASATRGADRAQATCTTHPGVSSPAAVAERQTELLPQYPVQVRVEPCLLHAETLQGDGGLLRAVNIGKKVSVRQVTVLLEETVQPSGEHSIVVLEEVPCGSPDC